MKKPATRQDFIDLINTMQHRERFCFDLKAKSDVSYTLEVYAADDSRNGNMFEDQFNITFQSVNAGGKWDKKHNFKKTMKRRILTAGGWGGDFKLLDTALNLME